MDISSIRLQNANLLIKKFCHGKKNVFADKIGTAPQNANKWWAKADRRNIGTNTARKIEKAFNLNEGWMDSSHPEDEFDADPVSKTKKKISAGDTRTIPLLGNCTLDNELALTLLSTNNKGALVLLSTDKDAYALQFLGHHSNPILSTGWGVVVEPNTPLTEGEYAIIRLHNGQILLRIITYTDHKLIIATNPLDKQQTTIIRNQIEKAEYCYIGIPPSKIVQE